MLMSSLKPDQQLLADTGSLRAFLPVGDISLNNYFDAFQRTPVALFVMNSIIVTGTTVILSLLICSMAAFSFVFLNWRGKDLILTIILATAAILKFLAKYNQYHWPLMVVQKEVYRPVMVGLQYFFQLNRAGGGNHGLPVADHRAFAGQSRPVPRLGRPDMGGPNVGAFEADHAVGHWHDRAMRDPWVMQDPDGPGYLMYFTARAPGNCGTQRGRGDRLCHVPRVV